MSVWPPRNPITYAFGGRWADAAPPEDDEDAALRNRPRTPSVFNYIESSCLLRLQELNPVWGNVSWGGLAKLLGEFGHEVLTMSLQDCWESRSQPKAAFPYLRSVCEGIRRKRVAANGRGHARDGER